MRALLIVLVLLLAACTTPSLPGAIDGRSYYEQGVKARTRSSGIAPQVGLALAGGGTKAANFSIGVLQGLTEAGVMEHVDAVSTVSGGGYAALWYFARLLNPDEHPKKGRDISREEFVTEFFTDCVPYKYFDYGYISESTRQVAPSKVCPNGLTNFLKQTRAPGHLDHNGFLRDEARYQNYLRGYQDLLGWIAPFRYSETTNGKPQVILDFVGLALMTIGAMGANVVPNLVFDWEIPLSPSRLSYEKGIVRTFGATPPNCSEHSATCEEDTRPPGDEEWVRTKLTFDLLRQEYENGSIPLWIINATAGENRSWLYFNGTPLQKRFQLTAFEFSPYGSGSGLFDYSTKQLNNLLPWEAAISSAAFFDSQQKVLRKWLAVVNPALNLTTFDWGRSVSNPHVSLAENLFHKLLPFPLYLLHGRAGDSAGDFVNIRLSDGGQSENLGAYALIQRKLEDIIVSDHSADRSGSMADICRLKYGLLRDQAQEPLYLYLPGLANLDQVCNQDLEMGYDIFRWEHPIVLGCITSNPRDVTCSGDEMLERRHFQRLYIIKPALPSSASHHAFGSVLATVATACRFGSSAQACKTVVQEKCHHFLAANSSSRQIIGTTGPTQSWVFENYLSCEFLGFMMINAFNDGGVNGDDLCPYVPQNDTGAITADSSPFLFGAYRELGSYYGRQLRWFFGADTNRSAVDAGTRQVRYREGILYQMKNAIIPMARFSDGKAGPIAVCLR